MSDSAEAVVSKQWDVQFDKGRHWRARIGFVLLPSEPTIEVDMLRYMPPGVGVHFTRTQMPREISPTSLSECAKDLAASASRIMPEENLDVVTYACTSGIIAIGEQKTVDELQKGAPNAKATSMGGAVRKALKVLDARRIVIGTPYLDEMNTEVVQIY